MLVLTRTVGEKIVLDGGITLVVIEIRGGEVEIGIDAPKGTKIRRAELPEREAEAGPRPGASDMVQKKFSAWLDWYYRLYHPAGGGGPPILGEAFEAGWYAYLNAESQRRIELRQQSEAGK